MKKETIWMKMLDTEEYVDLDGKTYRIVDTYLGGGKLYSIGLKPQLRISTPLVSVTRELIWIFNSGDIANRKPILEECVFGEDGYLKYSGLIRIPGVEY